MPDLRIHEYETRQELFQALPDTDVVGYDKRLSNYSAASQLYERLTGKKVRCAWRWKDLVFVGEEDGE